MKIKSFSLDTKTIEMIEMLRKHLQGFIFTKVSDSDVVRHAIEITYKEYIEGLSMVPQRSEDKELTSPK